MWGSKKVVYLIMQNEENNIMKTYIENIIKTGLENGLTLDQLMSNPEAAAKA